MTFDANTSRSPLKGRVSTSEGPGQDPSHDDDWGHQQDQNGKIKRLLSVWGLRLGGQLAHGATLGKDRDLPLQEHENHKYSKQPRQPLPLPQSKPLSTHIQTISAFPAFQLIEDAYATI